MARSFGREMAVVNQKIFKFEDNLSISLKTPKVLPIYIFDMVTSNLRFQNTFSSIKLSKSDYRRWVVGRKDVQCSSMYIVSEHTVLANQTQI